MRSHWKIHKGLFLRSFSIESSQKSQFLLKSNYFGENVLARMQSTAKNMADFMIIANKTFERDRNKLILAQIKVQLTRTAEIQLNIYEFIQVWKQFLTEITNLKELRCKNWWTLYRKTIKKSVSTLSKIITISALPISGWLHNC